MRPEPTYPGDPFLKAYDEGVEARRKGVKEDDNPYKPSGHERETTFDDQLHYYWWSGWSGFDEEDET